MKMRWIGPQPYMDVPAIGRRVTRGVVFEAPEGVDRDVIAGMLMQTDAYEAADAEALTLRDEAIAKWDQAIRDAMQPAGSRPTAEDEAERERLMGDLEPLTFENTSHSTPPAPPAGPVNTDPKEPA